MGQTQTSEKSERWAVKRCLHLISERIGCLQRIMKTNAGWETH
jgi:hypothetical protein